MSQFIPNAEGRFAAWANNFVAMVEEDPETYGLTADDLMDLKERNSRWDSDYADAIAKRDAARAATVAKQASRDDFESMLRELSRQIQSNPGISEESRRVVGLPVYKTTRTAPQIPSTVPVARVKESGPLAHVIAFADSATPTRRSRPAGVAGCQIFVAIGEAAPDDPDAYRFVTQTTRTPTRVTFKPEDGGQTAHYLLRWVNTRGKTGPWSTVLSATVAKV